MTTDNKDSSPKLEDKDILNYLRLDPNFFRRNPQILSELNLPHESGAAISLVERQIAILRERNLTMRRRMNQLVSAAKENEALFDKTKTLTLELLQAEGLHGLNEILATYVLADFQADLVCLHLENEKEVFDHLIGHDGQFPVLLEKCELKPVIQAFREEELSVIFPSINHDSSGSAVIAPIKITGQRAALAIGSKDPQYFTGDMDTLFIGYIADILSRLIQALTK
tara:strand:- start:133 stop:810 length:678 start_codon:yes stop_codon:yes gene_type:complete